MKGSIDRSAVVAFHIDGGRVHPDVGASSRGTEHERSDGGLADGRSGQGHHDRHRQGRTPEDRDALGAPAIDDDADDLHSRKGSDTQDEQHRPRHGVGHLDGLRKRRQVHRPR
jgi:hypothetical protein